LTYTLDIARMCHMSTASFSHIAGYVPVLVPEQRLQAVYRLLADDAITAAPDTTPPPDQAPADGDDWSGAADPRFRDPAFVKTHLATRSATIRGMAKYLAARPGQWLTSEPIAEALGLEYGWNSLAGALGAAGHYFKNRGIAMPWHWTYDTPDRHVQLMMDAETAAVITSVL
jgi:hypothetical protein